MFYIQVSKEMADVLVSMLKDREQNIKTDAEENGVLFSDCWDEYYSTRELRERIESHLNDDNNE